MNLAVELVEDLNADVAVAAEAGLDVRVADFAFFPFTDVFDEHDAQIERVEQLSDAHHVNLGDQSVMVSYLLELTRSKPQ